MPSKKLKALVKEPSKNEVRAIAKTKGIALSQIVNVAKPKMENRNKSKLQLIIAIQMSEGNNPCYKSITHCKNVECCWFKSCQ